MLYSILDISLLYEVPYKAYHLENWQVLQDTYDTVLKNLDDTEFIISFKEDNPPSIVEGKPIYNGEEIDKIINDPANGWIEKE